MDFVSGLVVYGPLGIIAAAALAAVVVLYRGEAKLRDDHVAKIEAMGKEHAAAQVVAATAFATQVSALGAAHAQTVREQGERYDRQVNELQQRTFTIVTTMSDKLSALADSLTRNRTR